MIQHTHVSPNLYEPATLFNFLTDIGPIMLLSLSFSGALFCFWYFVLELNKQEMERKIWLGQNKNLLLQYEDLHYLLDDFGQKVPCCSHCKNDKMQLWDYFHNLLVVRCTSCKMNYTFSKGYDELLQPLFCQLDGATALVNAVSRHRHELLGKHLARKFSIDVTGIHKNKSPLGVIKFNASRANATSIKSVFDISLNTWEVVTPEKRIAS
ncbi:hypothetical protein ACFQZJ_01475 [Maribacter chungangensis]|uniref:Uncharacterized protein n=1 Tax=Maribacter chungangensis TaxID=1069117 RepID=A0ABW3B0G5_9FLAO